MKTLYKILFSFILHIAICSLPFGEGWGGAVFAQTYPVQITTQLTPPFSGYLSDYSTSGNENFGVLLFFNDFTYPVYDVRLKVKIEGQGITIQSKPYYYTSAISLIPGQPMQLSGGDLAGLLNIKVLAENVKDDEDMKIIKKYNLYAVSR